jgi:hypothetical protein
MAYLLDANVFMQAQNLHYGFDFCPAFWDWLVHENAAGKVYSIEKVGDEIQVGTGDLTDWATTRGTSFFLPPTTDVLPALTKVSTWVAGQPNYAASAVSMFLQVADYYLVAQALAAGHVVVTHEVAAPHAIKKVKIPDVCIGLGVKCITPFEMLRKEGVSDEPCNWLSRGELS